MPATLSTVSPWRIRRSRIPMAGMGGGGDSAALHAWSMVVMRRILLVGFYFVGELLSQAFSRILTTIQLSQ